QTSKNSSNVLWYFELKLAGVLGFRPTFDRCITCGENMMNNEGEVKYHLSKGGPLCDGCAFVPGSTTSLSANALRLLDTIYAVEHIPDVLSIEVNTAMKSEIESFLWTYLRFHVSGMKTLKTE